jgi:uncharacterized protein (TIGR04255 family)
VKYNADMNEANNLMPPYRKPPIIEAVIALHFSAPLDLKLIDMFGRRVKSRFPQVEELVEMSATFIRGGWPNSDRPISGISA